MTLKYFRTNCTFSQMGDEFGLSEPAAFKNIKWTEKVLLASKIMQLKGLDSLRDISIKIVVIDGTKIKTLRKGTLSKKVQGANFTTKVQVVYEIAQKQILTLDAAPGNRHDWQVYLDLHTEFGEWTVIYADKAYIYLIKKYENAKVPAKSSKNNLLTEEQKKINEEISAIRSVVERIIRMMKIFPILGGVFRGSTQSLINTIKFVAGFVNSNLAA